MTQPSQYAMFDFTEANDAAIVAGSDWHVTLTYLDANGNPRDLTGFDGFMQIRSKPGGTLLADVTVAITPEIGEISLSLVAAETTVIAGQSGVYDLLIQSVTETVALMRGRVDILPGVTVIEA